MIACEEATAVGEEEEEGAFGCCGYVFFCFSWRVSVLIVEIFGRVAALRVVLRVGKG